MSLIIPAWNAAPTLDRTLRSARAQTGVDLEIIVVDDGATDDTAAIAMRHAERDPRIRLVHNERPRGVGGARNRGAAEAVHDHFCFLDADDVLVPDAIHARMTRLREIAADMAYAYTAIIDDDENFIRNAQQVDYNGDIFLELLRHGNFFANGSSIVVSRRAFEAVGGFSEDLFKAGSQGCEDYKFYLDVARRFPVACCDRVLIGYRQSYRNMSSDVEKMMRSFEMVRAEVVAGDPKLRRISRTARAKYLLYTGLFCIRRGEMTKGLAYLTRTGPSLSLWLVRSIWRRFRRALPGGARQVQLPAGYFRELSAAQEGL